jgi:hypothetical protein
MDLSLPPRARRLGGDAPPAQNDPRAIPIVALTGHASPSLSAGAQGARCSAFLTKPCAGTSSSDECSSGGHQAPALTKRRVSAAVKGSPTVQPRRGQDKGAVEEQRYCPQREAPHGHRALDLNPLASKGKRRAGAAARRARGAAASPARLRRLRETSGRSHARQNELLRHPLARLNPSA